MGTAANAARSVSSASSLVAVSSRGEGADAAYRKWASNACAVTARRKDGNVGLRTSHSCFSTASLTAGGCWAWAPTERKPPNIHAASAGDSEATTSPDPSMSSTAAVHGNATLVALSVWLTTASTRATSAAASAGGASRK